MKDVFQIVSYLEILLNPAKALFIYKTKKDAKDNKYTGFDKKTGWKRLLRGTNIGSYRTKWNGEYINYGTWLWSHREEKFFSRPKILLQALRNKSLPKRLVATYDEKKYYNAHNLANIISKDNSGYSLKYILAIFNSSLINGWYRENFPNVNINPNDFRKIPIKKATLRDQKPFIKLVDKILSLTKSSEYLDDSEEALKVREYEAQIDQMVYKLYGLTNKDIKIVEEK